MVEHRPDCAHRDGKAPPLPARKLIAHDDHWTAEHAWGSRVLGWLILSPRRPVRELSGLTSCEAAGLGVWQWRLARALEQEMSVSKVYVAEFGEAEGYDLHFHIVARPPDLAVDLRGPGVFALLGDEEPDRPTAAERDALADRIAARLEALDEPADMTKPLHDAGVLTGNLVRLRPPSRADIPALASIRRTPEVRARWRGGDDMVAAVTEDLDEPDSTPYVIEADGAVVGWIQWSAEDEPDYRHASIDIYLDPAVHGRGLGTDAVRTLARHLISDHRHHRIEIDPAADNHAAIRCYTKVGFRPVGVLRRSERGNDGSWHDALLMDLLADELLDEPTGSRT